MKKYKLHIELERDGVKLTLDEEVNELPNLQDYIFKKDLEAYNIVKFEFKEIEDQEQCQ